MIFIHGEVHLHLIEIRNAQFSRSTLYCNT